MGSAVSLRRAKDRRVYFINMESAVGYKVIFGVAPVANFPLLSFHLHIDKNLGRVFTR